MSSNTGMGNTQKILLGCAAVLAVLVAVAGVVDVAKHSGTSSLRPSKVIHTSGPVPQPPLKHTSFADNPNLANVLTATPGTAGYAAIVSAQGVPTSVLHITLCRPYPQVSVVTAGQALTIYNVDGTKHTLRGTAGSSFNVTISAKGSASFTPRATGAAPFSYTCDGSKAGAIVTSK